MGVTYKLTDEVVGFIISQRQSHPLASCRELAQSAFQKFGLRLSKSSVHDVLKQSGIMTPRGRKPKPAFSIPAEKKKQIQSNLSKVNIDLASSNVSAGGPGPAQILDPTGTVGGNLHLEMTEEVATPQSMAAQNGEKKGPIQRSPEYPNAGKVFSQAALWDMGIFSADTIKDTDWDYYLTYTKGIEVALEGNRSFFIDLVLPIERALREVTDGLMANHRPLVVDHVSDDGLFKACMNAEDGHHIQNICIVDHNDHKISCFCNHVVCKRRFIVDERIFVESNDRDISTRSRKLFFPQVIKNNELMENIINLSGYEFADTFEKAITLLPASNINIQILQEACATLNKMYIYDQEGRRMTVQIALK